MRPMSVINLIVLGTCFAVTFSLAAVLVVVFVLGDEYPRLARESDALVESLLIFLGMTAISGASFYLLVKSHPARYWLQAAMWLGLAGTGWYYWP